MRSSNRQDRPSYANNEHDWAEEEKDDVMEDLRDIRTYTAIKTKFENGKRSLSTSRMSDRSVKYSQNSSGA